MLQVDAEPIHPFAIANCTDIDSIAPTCQLTGHINPGTVLAVANTIQNPRPHPKSLTKARSRLINIKANARRLVAFVCKAISADR